MKNTFLLGLSLALFSMASHAHPVVSDGPYVDVDAQHLTFNWICEDKVNVARHPVNSREAKSAFNECGLSAKVGRTDFTEGLIEFSGVEKIVALSDLHGKYELTKMLLVNNGIINDDGQWLFGKGHFVITGDIFGRGDQVTEILWLIYDLEQQAKKAGGQVHLLLGNHEVMVLNGDLRYLNPKYVKTSQLLNTSFEALFNDSTILGRWIRSRPVLVKIDGYLFAHGGFHPHLAEQKLSLENINQVFKAHLVEPELSEKRSGLARYLHKTNGPVWYRGYFKDEGANEKEIAMLLNHFDVEHIVVGHTSQPTIETRFGGKVIAIDSSIKRGKYGEVLFIENGKHTRGTLKGERINLK